MDTFTASCSSPWLQADFNSPERALTVLQTVLTVSFLMTFPKVKPHDGLRDVGLLVVAISVPYVGRPRPGAGE